MNAFDSNKILLVATDLDDTLIDRSFILSPYTLEVLHRVQQQGTKIILATGRSHHSCAKYTSEIGLAGPIISLQGALIKSLEGKILYSAYLDSNAVLQALDLAELSGVQTNLFDDTNWYLANKDIEKEPWKILFTGIKPIPLENLRELSASGILKIVFTGKYSSLMDLKSKADLLLGNKYHIFFSQKELLEITSKQASKGIALEFICSRWKIDPKNVLSIGNAPNDISMFSFSGYSAAPSDAFPEVLEIVDQIIGPSPEDGVAKFLEEIFLNGK
jgi:Cof subfamily protein (haloacid dehalogenase superfamily)